MDWNRIQGNWKEYKGKIQQRWGELTDDEVDLIDGKREELSGRIQQKYGVAKDEAEGQIEDFIKSL